MKDSSFQTPKIGVCLADVTQGKLCDADNYKYNNESSPG